MSYIIPFDQKKRPRWNAKGWLPDNEVICGIFGSAGGGKTHYLRKLIPMIAPKLVKYVIIASRITNNKVYEEVEKWCQQQRIKYTFVSELDETKKAIMDMVNNKKREHHAILIFDDWNEGVVTDRSDKFAKVSNDCLTKLRNENVHMVYIVQAYSGLSAIARANLNSYVVFRNTGAVTRRMLATDWEQITGQSVETFEKLHNTISKIKHSYLCFTSEMVVVHLQDRMKEFEEKQIKF
jgi:hypothetical protein